jgi:hypothetical protein
MPGGMRCCWWSGKGGPSGAGTEVLIGDQGAGKSPAAQALLVQGPAREEGVNIVKYQQGQGQGERVGQCNRC